MIKGEKVEFSASCGPVKDVRLSTMSSGFCA